MPSTIAAKFSYIFCPPPFIPEEESQALPQFYSELL